MHYFVNEGDGEIVANITPEGQILNQVTGELMPFDGTYTFHKWESLVLIEDGTPNIEKSSPKKLRTLDLSGKWQIKDYGLNALTLDLCDVYFDGELVCKNESVIEVIDMACELKRNVNIRCDYKLISKAYPNIYQLLWRHRKSLMLRLTVWISKQKTLGIIVTKPSEF